MEICGKPGRLKFQRGAEPAADVYTAVHLAEKGGDKVTGMRACSACAGDYEDPDRTAWPPEGEEDEEREEAPAAGVITEEV